MKDGKLLHYRFDSCTIDDYALIWGNHPENNDLSKAEIVGNFRNARLKDGKVIADIHIDETKMSTDKWHYLWDHPDASIGYRYKQTKEGDTVYQDIHTINHVAIGIKEGTCSTPQCGLSSQADSKEKFSYTTSKEVLSMTDGPLEKYLEYENKITALEGDVKKLEGQIEESTESMKELDIEALKKDSDALAKIREVEKKDLIEKLVKETGKDTKDFEGETLENLNKFRALLPGTPPEKDGKIVLTGDTDDDRPEGMPKKATISYYGAPWKKDKPKDYVM